MSNPADSWKQNLQSTQLTILISPKGVVGGVSHRGNGFGNLLPHFAPNPSNGFAVDLFNEFSTTVISEVRKSPEMGVGRS